jgi:hypothetical protein
MVRASSKPPFSHRMYEHYKPCNKSSAPFPSLGNPNKQDIAIREPLQAPLWSPIIQDALIGYTAHWDVRALHGLQPPYVRILATALNMSRINVTMRFECKFYYDNGTTALTWGSLVEHKTNLGFFMLCPAHGLVHGDRDAPSSVSILCRECQSQWTFEVGLRDNESASSNFFIAPC